MLSGRLTNNMLLLNFIRLLEFAVRKDRRVQAVVKSDLNMNKLGRLEAAECGEC